MFKEAAVFGAIIGFLGGKLAADTLNGHLDAGAYAESIRNVYEVGGAIVGGVGISGLGAIHDTFSKYKPTY